MNNTDPMVPPSMLSWEFHARFFPGLLWARLSPKKDVPQGRSFNHDMGLTVMTVACVALLAVGVPLAAGPNALLGWPLLVLGLGGLLYLLVNSLAGQKGLQPTYEDFHLWIFFFVLLLGMSGGLFLTAVDHRPRLVVLAAGLGGLLPGYLAGIMAGLWAQRLGWIADLLNGLAGLAIFGLLIVDMLMLVA